MGFWGYDSFDSESAFGVGSYVYSPKRFFYGIFQGEWELRHLPRRRTG